MGTSTEQHYSQKNTIKRNTFTEYPDKMARRNKGRLPRNKHQRHDVTIIREACRTLISKHKFMEKP